MAYAFPRKSKYSHRVGQGIAGLGLFATAEMPRGAFVIEYFGTYLTAEQADKKAGKYQFEVNKNLVIDGATRKNIARYLNHSCKPNCYAEIDGKRIFMYTKRKIYAGEELCYHYGKGYWEDIIKPHGCKCPMHAKKKTPRLRG